MSKYHKCVKAFDFDVNFCSEVYDILNRESGVLGWYYVKLYWQIASAISEIPFDFSSKTQIIPYTDDETSKQVKKSTVSKLTQMTKESQGELNLFNHEDDIVYAYDFTHTSFFSSMKKIGSIGSDMSSMCLSSDEARYIVENFFIDIIEEDPKTSELTFVISKENEKWLKKDLIKFTSCQFGKRLGIAAGGYLYKRRKELFLFPERTYDIFSTFLNNIVDMLWEFLSDEKYSKQIAKALIYNYDLPKDIPTEVVSDMFCKFNKEPLGLHLYDTYESGPLSYVMFCSRTLGLFMSHKDDFENSFSDVSKNLYKEIKDFYYYLMEKHKGPVIPFQHTTGLCDYYKDNWYISGGYADLIGEFNGYWNLPADIDCHVALPDLSSIMVLEWSDELYEKIQKERKMKGE